MGFPLIRENPIIFNFYIIIDTNYNDINKITYYDSNNKRTKLLDNSNKINILLSIYILDDKIDIKL